MRRAARCRMPLPNAQVIGGDDLRDRAGPSKRRSTRRSGRARRSPSCARRCSSRRRDRASRRRHRAASSSGSSSASEAVTPANSGSKPFKYAAMRSGVSRLGSTLTNSTRGVSRGARLAMSARTCASRLSVSGQTSGQFVKPKKSSVKSPLKSLEVCFAAGFVDEAHVGERSRLGKLRRRLRRLAALAARQ